MSSRARFTERTHDELRARGIDPQRLPAGQYATERFPVLHIGTVPTYEHDEWDLTIGGDSVDTPMRFSLNELRSMPANDWTVDVHCVTKWSKFDVVWRGVALDQVLRSCGVTSRARTLLVHGDYNYSASHDWEDLCRHVALLAWAVDGEELTAEHGAPVRLVVPHRYLWKSVKWLRRIELWSDERLGFWERHGYHRDGDPFREQRFWGNDT